MATRTQRIPQASWDRHKETILSLYLTSDLSSDELVQTMDKDHGFSATISQYEAQLRVWNARKNLKRHEWDVVLQELDHLSSQGIQARVVISGHPVSVNRVHRARRHCKTVSHSRKRPRIEIDPHLTVNSIDGSVAVEVQDSHGNWTLHTNVAGRDAVPNTQQTGIDNLRDLPQSQEGNDGVGEAQDSLARDNGITNLLLQTNGPLTSPTIFPRLSPFHAVDLTSHNQSLSGDGENLVQTLDILSQPLQSYHAEANITSSALTLGTSPQSGDLAPWPWGTFHLRSLPFERFECELASRGLELTIRPSMFQDLRLLSKSPKLVTMFLADAVAAMINANGKPASTNVYGASLTLQTLDAILPVSQHRYGDYDVDRPSQEMLDVELCRILLFSTANGFIGLNHVPIQVVLEFITRYSNIETLLWRLFRDRPSHVTKSLAENLFRAVIETGDHNTIRHLLDTGLVHADTMICFVEDEKYTPIERVAELQKLEAVRELLLFQPHVNNTFFNYTAKDREDEYTFLRDRRGALGRLIEGLCYDHNERNHTLFSPEYMDIVDALIRAGAEVRVTFILRALHKFVRMDLAEKLLEEIKPESHALAISVGVLDAIARNLVDDKAERFITKILSDCEHIGCRQCTTKYAEKVNWALVVGASRGCTQLVRACFKYAKCTAQILAASIQSGNQELIEFVLAQNPDMHASATELTSDEFTTPIAEAIVAEDWTLVRELEAKGALERLDTGNRFVPTFSAVAGAGDVERMKKLLFLYPQFDGRDMVDALLNAATNKREDAFRLLLDAGAQPSVSGVYGTCYYEVQVLAEVFKWGNESFYTELISTYPHIGAYGATEGYLEEQFDNIDMLKFISQSGVFGIGAMEQFSTFSLKRNDKTLLRHCLELNMNINTHYQDLLELAARNHPDILRILFEFIPLMKNSIPHFGTHALVDAIRNNPEDLEVLELFISCKTVDCKSTTSPFLGSRSIPGYSPLGAAIRKDAECHPLDFPLTTRLLDAGCDSNSIVQIDLDNCNRRWAKTPLLVAIEARSEGLVRLLIERGAHVNKEATWGIRRTPIQASAEIGSLDIVKLLIQNGADVNSSPAQFDGRASLQCAAISGNCNIAALLIDQGADIFAPPSPFGGRWPIEAAAEHGRIEMTQYVWNASYGQISIEQCRKAMELARKNGHGACADLVRELAVTNEIMPTLEGSEQD
ncbi:ankyrin [Hypoxylon sp. FL1150]|nr:ankyrin [Hypoxylon sp. FL1150]